MRFSRRNYSNAWQNLPRELLSSADAVGMSVMPVSGQEFVHESALILRTPASVDRLEEVLDLAAQIRRTAITLMPF